MKRILLFLAASFVLSSCNKDHNFPNRTPETKTIEEQNSKDDAAIKKYLDDHYFNSQGKLERFKNGESPDSNRVKLSDLHPEFLPSGVVIVKREGAQPDNGTTIGNTDILHIMSKTSTFLSSVSDTDGYNSEREFPTSMDIIGGTDNDPYYYYVKKSTLNAENNTDEQKQRSYYEIEGFQDGIRKFKAFNKNLAENYNLQGVIIVPSRAAYARDAHYTNQYRNRNFVFNFQVYKSTPRTKDQE